MAIVDFITELFCRVDDQIKNIHGHSQQSLAPSELVTIGLLYAIKGVGARAFYRWLSANHLSMFPRLPERTRLFRRLRTHQDWRVYSPFTTLRACATLLLYERLCCRLASYTPEYIRLVRALVGLDAMSSSVGAEAIDADSDSTRATLNGRYASTRPCARRKWWFLPHATRPSG